MFKTLFKQTKFTEYSKLTLLITATIRKQLLCTGGKIIKEMRFCQISQKNFWKHKKTSNLKYAKMETDYKPTWFI